ncbi:MAG: type 4a pilus biogenesis protein PilO [Pseudomonadota bacterium]
MKLPALPWEKLDKLKRSYKLGIFFGTIILLGLGFFFLLHQPKTLEIAGLREDIAKLEAQIMQHRRAAREIHKIREELDKVRAQWDFSRELLPEGKEVPSLLRQISGNARTAGLNVTLFAPNPVEVKKSFFAEVSFETKLEGPFLNLLRFFSSVGSLPRVVNFSKIDMKSPKLVGGDMVLETSCTGTTFRFMTAEEIEAQKKAEEAAQRKKK